MTNSIYTINKGINKPIEFKGLKAQYIGCLAVGLLILLILFAVLYICGVNSFICVLITVFLGTALFSAVYHLSGTYGRYGLMKRISRRSVPKTLKIRSRKIFTQLLWKRN
jgi:Domain of unknown function (DUF4133)